MESSLKNRFELIFLIRFCCKNLFNFLFCIFFFSEYVNTKRLYVHSVYMFKSILIQIFVDDLARFPTFATVHFGGSRRGVPHVRYLLISKRRMFVFFFLFLDPRFPDRIAMLNGSRIRVCLHVTRLAFNEQPGKYANRKRRRSKCTPPNQRSASGEIYRVLIMRRRLLLITGFVDWQSHAVGSTHRRHGRRTSYRVHR